LLLKRPKALASPSLHTVGADPVTDPLAVAPPALLAKISKMYHNISKIVIQYHHILTREVTHYTITMRVDFHLLSWCWWPFICFNLH
jgi:hypothetical protein